MKEHDVAILPVVLRKSGHLASSSISEFQMLA